MQPVIEKDALEPARPRILYIEGHSALRDVLAQLLELVSHYEITVAGNGSEGVAKARLWQPDLILMGLRLPVMDGFKTIKVLRSEPTTATIPIIVLSAWDSARHRQRALAAGANEHFSSPIDLNRLLRRINRYLKRREIGI